jgi:putative transposase
MSHFSNALVDFCVKSQVEIAAWVLLPNHYHVLAKIHVPPLIKKGLGQLHGRTSHQWNIEEGLKGRKCFHGCSFRPIRSEAHKWSTLNYIHHNPVKHGYVDQWSDWSFGSARHYLKEMPRASVVEAWEAFPVSGMGKEWDE